MTPDSSQAVAVKARINELITGVSNSDFGILDDIYHADMRIYMLNGPDALSVSNKAQFTDHVRTSTEASEAPNMWAKFHLVQADAGNGHVLISRKVNLTGTEETVTLSIDLVFESGRWQITREVIFVP